MTKHKTKVYYDSHWKDFANSPYPAVKVEKVKEFFRPVLTSVGNIKTLLDVGSGDGVHWDYLKRIENVPIKYSGVDISEQAVNFLNQQAEKKNSAFHVMDACNLDFPDDHFDMVFAYGVIGYTEDPQKALLEMHRVCKSGGWIGIFSPEIAGISKSILLAVRSLAKMVGGQGKKFLADFLVPFFGLAPSETHINLRNASWIQVREVILTDIAPPKLEIIPYQTLIGWFEHLRIEIKFDNPKVKTTLWGLKS